MTDPGTDLTSSRPEVCLVATCHDPLGRFAPGIDHARGALSDLFAGVAVNVTSETHPGTLEALLRLDAPTSFARHGAGSVGVGQARTDALALGLETDSGCFLYSDLDHIVRWVTSSPAEVEARLDVRDRDLVVIGRSVVAMAAAPERLRVTEEMVNRVYGLANGLAERWDLMIAIRLMTRGTAETIVAHGRETSIANDVTWPMLVAAHGGRVGYVEGHEIRYLAGEDFGQEVDRRDHDPREWLARVTMAADHIRAIVDFDAGEPAA